MNFQIVVLMAVVACAFALPVPDEEVSTIKKNPDVTTSADDLTKPEPSLANVEDGLNTIVANVTTPKPEIESEVVKATDAKVETSSVAEEDIQEVPKSLPVLAGVAPPASESRAESVLAGIVPPVSEVRAEPKEAVEIAEAKSSVSSPDAEDKSDSSKPVAEVQSTTEEVLTQAVNASATEDKPKAEATESSASTKLPVAGENKTEDSSASTADAKKGDKVDKADKSDAKSKSKEAKSDKLDHSQESNKSEDSAESKESEESEENKKN